MNEIEGIQSLPTEVLNIILSYLSRKNKWMLRELSKDFRDHHIPNAIVSLRFKNMIKMAIPECPFIQKLEICNLKPESCFESIKYLSGTLNSENCRMYQSLKTLILHGIHFEDGAM